MVNDFAAQVDVDGLIEPFNSQSHHCIVCLVGNMQVQLTN